MISKKKLVKIALPVMLAVCFGLSGCGSAIPELDPETEQKVGEYAGLVMLRYDASHRSRLVKIPDELLDPVVEEPVEEEPVVEEPEPEVTQEPEEQVTVVDVSGEVETPEEEEVLPEVFMQLPEGVGLVYEGFSVGDSYPENSIDSYFSLDASEGKKLVVIHYLIYNQSGAPVLVDFLDDGYSFRATFNNSINRTALVTMLMDDMSTYKGTLDNMYGEKLVLIFEVDQDMEISSIVLNIKGYEGTCNVTLE